MTRCLPLRRLMDLGVSEDMTASDAKHVRITNIVAVLIAAMVLPWMPVNVWLGELFVAVENLVVGLLRLSVLVLNARRHHREGAT